VIGTVNAGFQFIVMQLQKWESSQP